MGSYLDAAAALLAGNTVVLKLSENTPLATLRAAELMQDVGLPDGVHRDLFPGRSAHPGPREQLAELHRPGRRKAAQLVGPRRRGRECGSTRLHRDQRIHAPGGSRR